MIKPMTVSFEYDCFVRFKIYFRFVITISIRQCLTRVSSPKYQTDSRQCQNHHLNIVKNNLLQNGRPTGLSVGRTRVCPAPGTIYNASYCVRKAKSTVLIRRFRVNRAYAQEVFCQS